MDQKIDYSKIYSPSKLRMFDLCPKQYQFYYLDPFYSKLKNDLKKLPQNIWSFHTLGKAVHNAITLFYHSPSDQRTEERLKEYLKETWQSEVMWQKKPPLGEWGGFKSLEEEREIYRQALAMLKHFLKMAQTDLEIEYLPTQDFKRSIEDYQRLIVPLSSEVDISGKFDLITRENDGSLRVVDFKTSKKEEADQFQLNFYKVLAEGNFQKPVSGASFYFVRTGNKKDFDLKKIGSETIKEEILEKVKQIRGTENFGPQPSMLCRFCLFKTFCPKKAEISEFTNDVQDKDFADDLPF